nr:hypothetical protein [uncultured bacterium]
MDSHVVVKRPLVTEKTTYASGEHNRYGFVVDRKARKDDIKRAIEDLYKVRVLSVTTQNRKGGTRRTRFGVITEPVRKHAFVRIHPDDTIELF